MRVAVLSSTSVVLIVVPVVLVVLVVPVVLVVLVVIVLIIIMVLVVLVEDVTLGDLKSSSRLTRRTKPNDTHYTSTSTFVVVLV